ncbi:Hsp70 family protein [Streptomyces cyaneofuscatus]|uniref:Hsp70 family protein n=1 Tax=Streptomyces cyaneofuscatus TaxID=66883 RepID=A0ABZ1F5P6_9ACTN|nr:Hsp70 family protein [Streptomyces cyaneofuscatus]WSB11464.1 Hsp70 family protein [Streptomyces cyaneofuscatus]WSD45002.1 Hsp70 family protein [Streptomyces cyaneofuscatus]WTA88197.1 Hsp70 family protein [Streptomyces cyaneofuscatus]
MTYGIDFGTSNSVVARWTGSGTEVIRLDSGGLPAEWNRPGFDELFPSVVSLRDIQRTLCFGWSAKCETAEPVDAVKRMLASRPRAADAEELASSGAVPEEHELWLGDEPFRSTTVAAALFDRMRVGVRRNLREMDEAVVTVPANATGAARYRTRAAARLAGIKVKALINEPTAAAVSYAHDYPGEGCFLVFDWGGGTIDVTILEHYDGIFDEVASRGITALGGLEFDEELVRLVFAKLGTDPGRLTRADARRWRRHVELTKIALSQPGTEEVLFEPLGGLSPVVIHREEFEGAVKTLIRRALVPVEECLRDVGLSPDDLDAVLMIGGTSQIPLVRREVERVLSREVVDARLCNPMTAVARGAAITAAEIDGLIPDTTVSVATSHDLGLSFEAGGRRGFATVIPRYSTLPARGSSSAMPATRGASRVILEIVEGDGQRAADDERTYPLARLELRVPQPHSDPASNVFDVDYHYDRSGILKVHARARNSGTVILDEELDCFGPDGTPIARGLDRELERLLRRISEPITEGVRPASEKEEEPTGFLVFPESETGVSTPSLVVDGRRIVIAGRTAASPRPPSLSLLGSALKAIRQRYPERRVVTVLGTDIVDAVEHEEQQLLDQAVAEGMIVTVPTASPQAVLNVAQQLDAVVVSMDDLTRFRTPHPWIVESGRFVKIARVEWSWVFA